MTVECEEFEYCKVKVHYEAPADLVEEKRDEAVAQIKKAKVKIPGFRPGKATNSAIRSSMRNQINHMVTKELVAEAYDEVLFETQMKPIGYPQIHAKRLDGDAFSCDMTFLKKPDFDLGTYKGLEIPSPHIVTTVTEGTEKMIQELRLRHGDVVPYGDDDFVQLGDKVTMDVKGEIDGTLEESISKDGMLYTIGENTIEEFDNNIYGMKAGDEREFDIAFEDAENIVQNLRGKTAHFTVTVHMGTKIIPCPLDDELAKKINLETYDQLRSEVEGAVSAQLNRSKQEQIQQQVGKQLLENHDFEAPYWLVLMEAQKMAAQNGLKWNELTDEQIDFVNSQSKDSVRLSLILDSIRDNEPDVVFSNQEILLKLKQHFEMNGQNAMEILSRAEKDGTLIGMIAALKDEATIHWIVENSNIVE